MAVFGIPEFTAVRAEGFAGCDDRIRPTLDIMLKEYRARHAPVYLRRRHTSFHLHSMVVILLFSLVGCQSDRPQPAPTFAETIAPIVYRNCAVCHRPGEAGPFPLLTYEDVVRKAQTIVAVTKARYMPPWPADPAYSHFLGERILSESDIQAIATWVENGTPLGDPAKAPKPPEFPSSSHGCPGSRREDAGTHHTSRGQHGPLPGD